MGAGSRNLFVAGLLAVMPVLAVAAPAETIRVGVLVDGPWAGNQILRGLTITETTVLTEGEFEVEFPDEIYLIGDWTPETARRNLQRLLDDPDVDVVVTWGLLASNAVCCLEDLPKPVIVPVVVEPDLQGFPLEDGSSGVPNLSYVSLPSSLAADLEYFRRMLPFERVAILINGALLDAIPQLATRTQEQLDAVDLEFEYAPVRDSIEEGLASISDEVDAVYVWPLFHISREDYQRLIDSLNERGLPTFSALGGTDLEMECSPAAGRRSSSRDSRDAWR